MRSLADWSGKSLIVNFWATWCAPCRREIPLLEKLQAAVRSRRLPGDRHRRGLPRQGHRLRRRDRIGYPLLIGEQEALDAAAAFGVEVVGFPFTIFSDRQGRIVAAHVGELTAAQAEVILGAVAG